VLRIKQDHQKGSSEEFGQAFSIPLSNSGSVSREMELKNPASSLFSLSLRLIRNIAATQS
jgi:hypothetical protein